MNENKVVYISVPITGYDRKIVLDKVARAKAKILSMGYSCMSMTDLLPEDVEYHTAMAESIRFLLLCDGIYMCDNWMFSKGCNSEYRVAEVYGKELIF